MIRIRVNPKQGARGTASKRLAIPALHNNTFQSGIIQRRNRNTKNAKKTVCTKENGVLAIRFQKQQRGSIKTFCLHTKSQTQCKRF